MKRLGINELYDLIEKLVSDFKNPYYQIKGNNIYKDSLILLRTNFYEPLLNEKFTKFHESKFKEYFSIKNNGKRFDKENIGLYEKLVTVYFGYRSQEFDSSIPIFLIHNDFLNESVHLGNNVSMDNYTFCLYHVQEFAYKILNGDFKRKYQSMTQIKEYILSGSDKALQSPESSVWLMEEIAIRDKEIQKLRLELELERKTVELIKLYDVNEKKKFDYEIERLRKEIDGLENQLSVL